MELRKLIFAVAKQDPEIGELEETLKWGELAYLTAASHSGTTRRLGWSAKRPDQFGIYVHCQTSLIHAFQSLFPNTFVCEGNRGLIFEVNDQLPTAELKICITMALRYHLDKS